MDYESIKLFAQEIINNSLAFCIGNIKNTLEINQYLINYEKNTFNITSQTERLIDNNINYDAFLQLVNNNSPQNILWLKNLRNNGSLNIYPVRYPIKAVVLVEGITEEILLPVFSKICGFDFDTAGIQLISAGGKNQVVKLFYKFAEQLKIPIFVLLDSDAKQNCEQIKCKLRKFDKIHILKNGEFEDILPVNLIKRTLNDYFRNLNSVSDEELSKDRMVYNLEEIFKKKGFHEFKKAEFAQLISTQANSKEDISDEIKTVISEIKKVTSCLLQ